jgi:hypothetical protein
MKFLIVLIIAIIWSVYVLPKFNLPLWIELILSFLVGMALSEIFPF